MKTVVVILHIDVELYIPQIDIQSSEDPNLIEIPEFLSSIGNNVANIALDKGFHPLYNGTRHISRINNGLSIYSTYTLQDNNLTIKLILDIRIADHPAKPNLETRNKARIEVMKESYPEIKNGTAKPEVLDAYCKKHDWGLQIFVGGDKEYSKPVTSVEGLQRILDGKFSKLVKNYLGDQ